MQLIFLGILGLLFGSFINVIIYRIPIMINRYYLEVYEETMGQKAVQQDTFNLAWPASFCPICHHSLKWWHNIPIISYLILKGKCAFCETRISIQYPLVECLTSVISILAGIHFSNNLQNLAFSLIFSWILIALIFIDLQKQILPDELTLSLLWLGLIFNLHQNFTLLSDAVLGAFWGYMSLWIIAQLFKIIKKTEGLGYGDCKLVAAFGAWFGWQALPNILLISSLVALLTNTVIMVYKREKNFQQRFAFGPYLALAGFITLLSL